MKRLDRLLVFANTVLLFNGLLFAQSNYFQFGNLNQNHVDVDSEWTEVPTGVHSFTKSSNTTTIEVYVNSRFGAAAIDGNGVSFQVRVDGSPPTVENEGSLVAINQSDFSHLARSYFSEFLSIFAVFQKLPAGTHAVSIWAQAPNGHARRVGADPGGWGGTIIVKEAFSPPGNFTTMTGGGSTGSDAGANLAPTPQASEAPNTAKAESQPRAPFAAGQTENNAPATVPSGPRNLSEAEAALQTGRLAVYVPRSYEQGPTNAPASQRYHDYPWERLQTEFKSDFPNFTLIFHVLDRDEFLRRMHAPPEELSLPDVAFIDNYGELRPFLKDNALVKMWGQGRFGGAGWWVAFRQAKNFAGGEAFFLWLAQSPHWKPWAASTNSLGEKNISAIQKIAQAAVQDFANTDAPSLECILDPEAGRFQDFGPQGKISLRSVDPVLTFGNSWLSFVLLTAVGEGDQTFGLSHFGIVLRNTGAGWKVLLILSSARLDDLERFFRSFDRLQLQEGGDEAVPNVSLLAPADWAQLPRVPPSEIEWSAVDAPIATYVVESQYSTSLSNRPREEKWTTSWIRLVPPISEGSSLHMGTPFGVGMQPHRWRVWAISKSGVVSLSEWRVIDFTN